MVPLADRKIRFTAAKIAKVLRSREETAALEHLAPAYEFVCIVMRTAMLKLAVAVLTTAKRESRESDRKRFPCGNESTQVRVRGTDSARCKSHECRVLIAVRLAKEVFLAGPDGENTICSGLPCQWVAEGSLKKVRLPSMIHQEQFANVHTAHSTSSHDSEAGEGSEAEARLRCLQRSIRSQTRYREFP